MNDYLNYLVESNLALLIFVGFYLLLFRRETDFHAKRIILLAGVLASLLFPLLHFETFSSASIPTINAIVPTVLLPEVVVGAEGSSSSMIAFHWASWIGTLYAAGVGISLFLFLRDVFRLTMKIRNAKRITAFPFVIAETDDSTPGFSFFNIIFISKGASLTESEKAQIIAHESVHAERLHSFDILLINVIKIFFWFNPLVRTIKNIFIELHEFEADARAVRKHAVSDYCNLLAKVALMSADLRLANYFTNSLTLKRIEMIRKIKMKIGGWKFAAASTVLPLLFVVVSCQEQVIGEASELAKSSSVAIDVPAEVQLQYDQMKAAKPGMNLLLLEVDESGKAKLEDMEKKMKSIDESRIASVNVIKTKPQGTTPARNFIIVEYNETMAEVSGRSQTDDVFMIVEETAEPVGGITELYSFIGNNLVYPQDARDKGIQGQVFVEFVVEKDGSISSAKVAKGVDPLLDKAAVDLVAQLPKWTPARNKGIVVRQKMVLPVNFKLG